MTLAERVISLLKDALPDVDALTRLRLAARLLAHVVQPAVDHHGKDHMQAPARIPTAEGLASAIERVAGVWSPSFTEHANAFDLREVARCRERIEAEEARIEAVFNRVYQRSLLKKPRQGLCQCGAIIIQHAGGELRCRCGRPKVAKL